MEEYGMFLDAGVYGSDPSLANTIKSKGKQKGRDTRSVFTGADGIAEKFSYKSKRPPMQRLADLGKKKHMIKLKRKNGSVASYTSDSVLDYRIAYLHKVYLLLYSLLILF